MSLSEASTRPVTIDYTTIDGTARAGADYVATSGILELAPGETSRTVKVEVIGDELDEEDETFSVKLTGAIYASLEEPSATATIMDDDAPPVLNVSVNLGILWPPNHKIVEIQPLIEVSDDRDPNPIVKLESITSNESPNGTGDGNTDNDIEVTADGRIFLRAERSD